MGHASPIVWQDRVFLVSCREDRQDRILLCLDRKSGEILWEQTVVNTPLERRYARTPRHPPPSGRPSRRP